MTVLQHTEQGCWENKPQSLRHILYWDKLHPFTSCWAARLVASRLSDLWLWVRFLNTFLSFAAKSCFAVFILCLTGSAMFFYQHGKFIYFEFKEVPALNYGRLIECYHFCGIFLSRYCFFRVGCRRWWY